MTRLKKVFLLFILLSGCFSVSHVIAQQVDIDDIFIKFSALYTSGDFIGAEKCMLLVLDSKNNVPENYVAAAFNDLGVI
jgi:hypothetical protein